jgi:ATP-dependent Lon protease
MPAGPVFRYGTGGFVKDMGDGMETFKVSNKVREKSMMALSVYNVGRQQCTPGYKWGPGVRDHFLIHYITGGKGTYTVGERERPLSGGDVFIVFPGMVADYDIKYQPCFHACMYALKEDSTVFLVSYQKMPFSPADAAITPENLRKVGTLARIEKALTQPDGTPRVVLRGIARAELLQILPLSGNAFSAEVLCKTYEPDLSSPASLALLKALQDSFVSYCRALPQPIPESLADAVRSFRDPALLADFIISNLAYLPETKQSMLDIFDPEARVLEVIVWLRSEPLDREQQEL